MPQILLGPWGIADDRGEFFDHSGYDGIKMIVISHGAGIDKLRVLYVKEGNEYWEEAGGPGGGPSTVRLDYPNEYLVGLKGHYGFCAGKPIIKSLTLYSNLKTYGRFGEESGTPFDIPAKGARIVGFHGKAIPFISPLGIYIKPLEASRPRNVISHPAYDAGPWGGDGGTPWDDGVSSRVKQIIVTLDDGVIRSIQPVYDRQGVSYKAPVRGKPSYTNSSTVTFEQPDEYLERITGIIAPLKTHPKTSFVKALTFISNKKAYPTIGEVQGQGEYFSSSGAKGEILGFFGRSANFVEAIGVHIRYDTFSLN